MTVKVVFHIGYHKTGTTWLQRYYFPAHPYIHPICKSQQPWNDPLLQALIATPDGKFDPDYCSQLIDEKIRLAGADRDNHLVVVSAERLSGHPYSGGYDSFRIAERIRACWKDAWIFYAIRRQSDVIWSFYKQMVREGLPCSFARLFTVRHWDTPGFDLSFYEYDVLLRKYQGMFGQERVCVLPYELMCIDIQKFLHLLCAFFGIPDIPVPVTEKANRGLANRGLALFRIINHFYSSEFNPYPLFSFNKQMLQYVRRVMEKIFHSIPDTGMPLQDKQGSCISDYYQESNSRLQSLVSWKLKDFGW